MEINTGTMSSGPNEANAKVYQTLVEGLDNATAYSVSVLGSIDLSDYGIGIVRIVIYPTEYGFTDGAISFVVVDGTGYAVYEDGSIAKVEQSL